MDFETNFSRGTPAVYCITCVYKEVTYVYAFVNFNKCLYIYIYFFTYIHIYIYIIYDYMHVYFAYFWVGYLSLSLYAMGISTSIFTFVTKTHCNPVRRMHVSPAVSFKPTLYLIFCVCSWQSVGAIFPAMLTCHHPSAPVGPSTCVKAGAGSSSLNTSTFRAMGNSTCSGPKRIQAIDMWFKYCWRPGSIHRICASQTSTFSCFDRLDRDICSSFHQALPLHVAPYLRVLTWDQEAHNLFKICQEHGCKTWAFHLCLFFG